MTPARLLTVKEIYFNVLESIALCEISSVGFISTKVTITTKPKVNVTLKDEALLNEIVVSASRTPERVLESPVTIERMGIADIKKSASATFMTDWKI
jgi:hypothetical protein